jgi:hypothetical protein
MSHVRRTIAVILLGCTGWLTVSGVVGAVTAPASAANTAAEFSPTQVCC